MAGGIRAEVTVRDPGTCPVAALSDDHGATLSGVTWCDCPTATLVEFTAPDDTLDPAHHDDLTSVYEADGRARYRVTLPKATPTTATAAPRRPASDGGTRCPCAVLRESAQPVADVRVDAGSLSLTFYAADVDAVRDVLDDLRDRFESVSLERLSNGDGGPADDLVTVDRARLTDRQREVLETAHEMGYFGRRRGANAAEVAAALDISTSTFAEHVGSALDKVLSQLFE